LVSVICT